MPGGLATGKRERMLACSEIPNIFDRLLECVTETSNTGHFTEKGDASVTFPCLTRPITALRERYGTWHSVA